MLLALCCINWYYIYRYSTIITYWRDTEQTRSHVRWCALASLGTNVGTVLGPQQHDLQVDRLKTYKDKTISYNVTCAYLKSLSQTNINAWKNGLTKTEINAEPQAKAFVDSFQTSVMDVLQLTTAQVSVSKLSTKNPITLSGCTTGSQQAKGRRRLLTDTESSDLSLTVHYSTSI